MTQNYREELVRELLESCTKSMTDDEIVAAINAAMSCSGSITDEQLKAFADEIKSITHDTEMHTVDYKLK